MKILLYDIENSPNLSYTWGKYEQNVIDFEQEWYMLSFAYKFLGDRGVKAFSLPDFKNYKKDKTDDSALLQELWTILDEADVVVGHNSNAFDNRKSNARFLFNGMKPPSPYQTFDTLKQARKHFMFNSNKLDHLTKFLGLGTKIETGGFGLWLDCMAGNKSAWKKMVKYNKHDVTLLEEIYLKIRPWTTTHPNVNVLDEKTGSCPTCGSGNVQKRGWSITTISKKQRFHCQSCGKWSTGKPTAVKGLLR